MKVTLESTSKIVDLVVGQGDPTPARLWEGTTESGIPVIAFVTRILTSVDADQTQFQTELQEQRPASEFASAIPMRLIL